MLPFPEPTKPAASRNEVFTGYLDFFRSRVIDKITELPEPELRTSRVPSGWTPLELVKHLTFVELRWIEWGFQGRPVEKPWGDWKDDRWHVDPAETRESLLEALRTQGRHTTSVIETTDLSEVGQPGPRWKGAEPATLERVLFHLVQEYARHLGHLDIITEQATTEPGE
ncbi:Uncharacterized damage-inducible protein DinB (forms a four-helix bundle) [Saccharopolyspora antimicrobica]|uniref:Damage-inducible protein DinB n=1 Tax=Saccharopolyspora antimicrobica TaxID=455193 RepID=A0A1I4XRD6_9PSEU|nr:DinB family protein [Saccharopolyspora antimicrobica]RKT84614.1 putative damage-inducible protein DinB [Saccharopolyspora antimicrobica]SFN28347.1 Uncharacterized damage-inducible protein DinB (forms a four-helix bundle) [Saccharopolyspora antimicrobica]